MSTDPNAITARHARVPGAENESAIAESKGQIVPRGESPAVTSKKEARPGNREVNGGIDRAGQSHRVYLATVGISSGSTSVAKSEPPTNPEAEKEEPQAASESASVAQIGGG